jgi:hypothetical protein
MAVDAALAARSSIAVRREALAAAGIAAGIGGLLVAFGPPAGDAAAHLYRTELVREGVLVWDGYWYAGHYPLASYSLLGYLPAALVGSVALALVAVVASAALFAAITVAEWEDAARWPSRAFAVLACTPLFTGTYPFALGLAAALGAIRALQSGRTLLGLVAAAVAAAVSPLAFVFLCAVLLAAAFAYRPPARRVLVVAGGLVAIAGAVLAIQELFRSEGRYEFAAGELALALAACALGALVAAQTSEGRLLAVLFVVLGVACLIAYAFPSQVGANITRFRTYVFPLVLLAASLAAFRPRWLMIPAAAAALAYSVWPFVVPASGLTDARAAEAEFWEPSIDFLRARLEPGERVDVVPTLDNWEAYHLPHAGIPLARGWFRQLDLERNPVLYEDDLTGAEYEAWLRSLGVRFVVLPLAPLDRLGAEPQAELVRSGRSGLVEVARVPEAVVYELPGATPLLTGPGDARISAYEHARIAGDVGAPGAYLLRVRYTPYLAVRRGDVCLEPGPGGMTRLVAASAGPFELAVPPAGDMLETALGDHEMSC